MLDRFLRVGLCTALTICFAFGEATGQTSPITASPAPSSAGTATPTPNGRLLPGGTSVTVALLEEISSATAHEGDQIGIVAKKEVRVRGIMLIAEGATGHATVTTV